MKVSDRESLLGPPAARIRSNPSRPGLGRRGARVLLVAVVVAVLAGLGWFQLSRPRVEPPPEPPTAPVAAPSTPAAEPSAGTEPVAAPSSGPRLVVHVLGKVRRPGVVELPPGARVRDALDAAGGPRPGVDTGTLNLARRIVDGEQIAVGVRGAPPPPPTPAQGPPGAPGAPATQVDLNTATTEQLQELPGVGPVLAQRIIEHRTRNGPFRSVDQLQEVSGVGPARFAELRTRVRV